MDRLTLPASPCRYTKAYLRRAITRHRFNLPQNTVKGCIYLYLDLCICIYTPVMDCLALSALPCRYTKAYLRRAITRYMFNLSQGAIKDCIYLYVSVSMYMYIHP